MREKFFNLLKSEKEIAFLLGIIFLITFSHFIFTGFATCDDYAYYCRYFNDTNSWEKSYLIAIDQGRFYFSFMMSTFAIYIPFMFGSYIASRILTLAFLIMGAFIFAKNIQKIFKNATIAYLFLLIYIVFVSIKAQNSAITAFPVYFSLSWALLQTSIYFYLKFLDHDIKKYKNVSIILFGCTILFYEMYLLYIVVFFALHIIYRYKDQKLKEYIKNALYTNYPYLILNSVYVIIYISFKNMYSQELYDGVHISSSFSFDSFIDAMAQLTKGGLPLNFYFTSTGIYDNTSYILGGHIQNVFNPIVNIKLEWLIKSICVGTLFILLTKNSSKINILTTFQKIAFILLGIFLLIIPNFLLAITEKYQSAAKQGFDNYLTTYYSSFIMYVLIAILFYYLITHRINVIKKTAKYTLLVFLMWSSVLMDYANYHAEADLNRVYKLFSSVDDLLKTDEITKLPNQKIVFISPDLYSYNSSISYYNCCGFDWSPYFKAKTQKNIIVKKTILEVDTIKHIPMYKLDYKNFIDGNYFLLSTVVKDCTSTKTLFVQSTKPTVLLNYKIGNRIESHKILLNNKNRYDIIQLHQQANIADTIWISDVVN